MGAMGIPSSVLSIHGLEVLIKQRCQKEDKSGEVSDISGEYTEVIPGVFEFSILGPEEDRYGIPICTEDFGTFHA